MGAYQLHAPSTVRIACPKCKKIGTLVTAGALPSSCSTSLPRVVCDLSAGFISIESHRAGNSRVECAICRIPVTER